MTKGYALYRIWNLAADAIDAGGNPDFIIGKMDYIYKADVSKAETDGQLLAALEEVEPKWYSLTKPLDATRS